MRTPRRYERRHRVRQHLPAPCAPSSLPLHLGAPSSDAPSERSRSNVRPGESHDDGLPARRVGASARAGRGRGPPPRYGRAARAGRGQRPLSLRHRDGPDPGSRRHCPRLADALHPGPRDRRLDRGSRRGRHRVRSRRRGSAGVAELLRRLLVVRPGTGQRVPARRGGEGLREGRWPRAVRARRLRARRDRRSGRSIRWSRARSPTPAPRRTTR